MKYVIETGILPTAIKIEHKLGRPARFGLHHLRNVGDSFQLIARDVAPLRREIRRSFPPAQRLDFHIGCSRTGTTRCWRVR